MWVRYLQQVIINLLECIGFNKLKSVQYLSISDEL